jgi:hypothetical protein
VIDPWLDRFQLSRSEALAFAVVLPAVVITVLWLIATPGFLTSGDSFAAYAPDYKKQVDDLLDGKGFESFYYPPLFPLALAGIQRISAFAGVSSGLLGGLFLCSLAILGSLLVFLIAESLFGHRLAILPVAGWCVYPVFLRMWMQPLSATPFTVLLLASALIMTKCARHRRPPIMVFGSVGVVLGLAMLIRPIGLGLGCVFAVVIFSKKETWSLRVRAAGATAMLTAQILAIAPWESYVFRRTGQIVPLSTAGTGAILDGLTYAVDPSENRAVSVPTNVRHLQERIYDGSYTDLTGVGSIALFLIQESRRDPIAVTGLFAIKAARAWYGTDSGRLDGWVLGLQSAVVPVLIVALWSGWQSGGPARDFAALAGLSVLYFWSMTTISLSIVRYMVPALALIIVLTPCLVSRQPSRRFKLESDRHEGENGIPFS